MHSVLFSSIKLNAYNINDQKKQICELVNTCPFKKQSIESLNDFLVQ